MLNNCYCDNLPPVGRLEFIRPTGVIRQFICDCLRKSPHTFWADYNGVSALTCGICRKVREPIRKCRLCDDLYVYVGRPLLCSHYPCICRDCLRTGAYAQSTGDTRENVSAIAGSERGLYFRHRAISVDVKDVDALLKELNI